MESETGKQQVKTPTVRLPGDFVSCPPAGMLLSPRPPRPRSDSRRLDAGLSWETSARHAPRNVVIVIRNRSTATLSLAASGWRIDSGFWSEKPPLCVAPNSEARFGSESHSWFSAVMGDVKYEAKRITLKDGSTDILPLGLVSFAWENAVIGGNSYSSSQPDSLACHYAGGEGSNCTVMFTLTDRAPCIHRASVLGDAEVALRLKEESERRRSSLIGGSVLGFDIRIDLPNSLQPSPSPDLQTVVMRCPYCCCELACPVSCTQFECGNCGSVLMHAAPSDNGSPVVSGRASEEASLLRKIFDRS